LGTTVKDKRGGSAGRGRKGGVRGDNARPLGKIRDQGKEVRGFHENRGRLCYIGMHLTGKTRKKKKIEKQLF